MLLMNKYVLDSSAVLALINHEEGENKVQAITKDSIISTVNYSEVATVLNTLGMPCQEIEEIFPELGIKIIPFETSHALLAAEFRMKTKHKGFSLGDRACLALGKISNLPVLSADKIWKTLELDLEILLIR